MYRILTATSILALATLPAMAQQADPMTSAPTTGAPTTGTETTQTPATPTPDSTNASPTPMEQPTPEPMSEPTTSEAVPTTGTNSREAAVTSLVEAEFPTYDADKDGDLSQAEFTTWVMALQAKAEETGGAAEKDEAAKAKWAKDAFASADTDKNKKISKAEVSSFLLG